MIIQHLKPTQREISLIEKNSEHLGDINYLNFKNITVEKPWGEEYLLFENKDAAIWILKLAPHKSTSFHAHSNKITSLIVLEGKASCKTFTKDYVFQPLEAIVLGKKVFHQTINVTTDDLYLMEIESPVNKFDLVRYKDNYGRSGQSYESKKHFKVTTDSYMASGTIQIGHASVRLNFAKNTSEFLEKVSMEKNAIITILDRHIWSNTGAKLIEVGSSFKLDEIEEEFMINDQFHYIIIH
ncbi:MAG: hypothetical protein GY694_11855 [Gammaproteobacteria bacterium]|nr:hypothetical protein [Gammaproteobacteria bacterium]